MAGLEQPDEGEVYLDGEPIHTYKEEQLATLRSQKIGIIFQSFYLHHAMTAEQNVRLAAELSLKSEPKKISRLALEQVGLGHRLTHKPSQLSGGEQQRVCIARVLVTQAPLSYVMNQQEVLILKMLIIFLNYF